MVSNSEAPNFTAETTQGPIKFHDWVGNGWAILFSHPKDFTPVCATELGYMARLEPEFAKRNTKISGFDKILLHVDYNNGGFQMDKVRVGTTFADVRRAE